VADRSTPSLATSTTIAVSDTSSNEELGTHRVFYDRHGNAFDESGNSIFDDNSIAATDATANDLPPDAPGASGFASSFDGTGTSSTTASSTTSPISASFHYRDKRLTQQQYDRHNALLERMRFGGKHWENRPKPIPMSGQIGKDILRRPPPGLRVRNPKLERGS
jgi:hypothetical protein